MNSQARSEVGSPNYCAPEVLMGIYGYDGKMADGT